MKKKNRSRVAFSSLFAYFFSSFILMLEVTKNNTVLVMGAVYEQLSIFGA
jgi:hypothetical protein